MGYRNPATSAGTLDTGQGFATGSVESYTDNPTGPLGTPLHTGAGFLFRDGITGDTPAKLVNSAYYTAQGNNSLTEQGGSLALAAGSYNGVTGPELDLNVESAPAGGYRAFARLLGAKFFARFAGPIQPGATNGAFVFASPWATYDSVQHASDARWAGHGGFEVYLDAAGTVHLEGLLTVTVTTAPGGVIGTLTQDYWPRKRLLRHSIANGSLIRIDVDDTNGQVTYQTGPTLTAGQYLSLNLDWPSRDL